MRSPPKVMEVATAQNEFTRARVRAGADSSSSNTSFSDQQSAAPKVASPVTNHESSAQSAKQPATEVEPVREEDKNGHYFMKVIDSCA